MNEQEVLRMMADSLDHLAHDYFGSGFRQREANRLRAEADRLTPKPAEPAFEGVKYVVFTNHDGPAADATHYHIITEAAWAAQRSPVPTLRRDVGDWLFLESPDGSTWAIQLFNVHELAPWAPKVGEKVRDEADPSRIGVVARITIPGQTYYVDWGAGGLYHWGLFHLRPFAFAPPEPEKPEFELGSIIADTNGWVRVVSEPPMLVQLDGEATRVAMAGVDWHLASDAEIQKALSREPLLASALARAHAKHIAGEAT